MRDRDGNEWVLVPASLTTDMACGAMSVWADGGKDFGQMYAAAIAAAPQFIAPEVDDEMCISVGEEFSRINAVNCGKLVTPSIWTSRSMIAAVRSELGPHLGLVELREPTEADARITELETAITVRDTEIARLETDLELARAEVNRLDQRVDGLRSAIEHGQAIRAIDAAPDMYAALKELAECSQYWSDYDVPLGIHDRIAAALAKAVAK